MSSHDVDNWLTTAPEAQQATLSELRELVKSLGPDVVEEFKWSRPCYSNQHGPFCYLHSTKSHATLGFQKGTSLNDPENLLEGTGKDMRHIKFKGGADFERSAVTALLKQAMAQ